MKEMVKSPSVVLWLCIIALQEENHGSVRYYILKLLPMFVTKFSWLIIITSDGLQSLCFWHLLAAVAGLIQTKWRFKSDSI